MPPSDKPQTMAPSHRLGGAQRGCGVFRCSQCGPLTSSMNPSLPGALQTGGRHQAEPNVTQGRALVLTEAAPLRTFSKAITWLVSSSPSSRLVCVCVFFFSVHAELLCRFPLPCQATSRQLRGPLPLLALFEGFLTPLQLSCLQEPVPPRTILLSTKQDNTAALGVSHF